MRVVNRLQVHAPQFRPAPGRLRHARDIPERVAAFDDVHVGSIGGEFGQRHPLVRNLFGGAALGRRDGWGLCLDRRGSQGGAEEAIAPAAARRTLVIAAILFLFSCIAEGPSLAPQHTPERARAAKYITNQLRFSAQALDSAMIIGYAGCADPKKWRK